MPRTTAAAVKAIVEVDATISVDLAPYIETANALVTEVCGDAGYNDSRLELIERWLSAHFYAVRDPRASSERAGPVSASYLNQVGLGFAQTREGQQAMLLDTAGGLAKLNKDMELGRKTPKPGVLWGGTELT